MQSAPFNEKCQETDCRGCQGCVRHKYDCVSFHTTKQEAQEYASIYEQYGRFRIVQDRQTGKWKCFAYEAGQHPYSRR